MILLKVSNKSELKKLLSLATKESYLIFNGFLYKEIDHVAIMKKIWLEQYPEEFKSVYYKILLPDIFVSFRSCNHLINLGIILL